MKTILIDTEGGYIPVKPLIDAGLVEHIHAPEYGPMTFEEVEKAFWAVKRGQVQGDVLVIDTLTALTSTTRQDVVAGRVSGSDIWANRAKLATEQRDWGIASDYLIRLSRLVRGLPMLTILACHESLKSDNATGEAKGGPGLNPQLLDDVRNFSDDIFRISSIDVPTSIDGKRFERGTRFLRMQTSDRFFTKVRVPPNCAVPELLPNPTLPAVKDVLGDYFPRRLTIFGPTGAGKTTFCCSFSTPNEQRKTA